ncbi:thiamine pyrophosphate-binding protein [Leucobacter coleopterorum]|uniref:thiamine pyrophosphate-binding protein n=1 Tax=Leucobacter coleopterorum TaxID=2714933 RepID=UPI003CC765EC
MSAPSTSTLTHAVAQALARHTTHSFGLMGNGNAHLIEHFAEVGISYTAVRHEAGTVAAADAFTRVSGQLAIATTTYGAGFTNTLTALAEAAQARTPMLVVVGEAPSDGPRPGTLTKSCSPRPSGCAPTCSL